MRSPRRPSKSVPAWHPGFLAVLPAIVKQVRFAFRHLGPEARAEALQNCIANAMVAYARLYELGRIALAYPSVLGRYAIAQTKDFRVVGGHLDIQDVLSPYCQAKKNLVVERLDHYDRTEDEWQEILVEDHRAGPFDIVRTKLDFAAWLRSLPSKSRRIAKMLANGERTTDVARRFGLSDGRISQIRTELPRPGTASSAMRKRRKPPPWPHSRMGNGRPIEPPSLPPRRRSLRPYT